MNKDEIEANLKILQNNRLKVSESSGIAVDVEIRMRILLELDSDLREELERQINAKKIKNKNYWDCNLVFIESAIIKKYENKLKLAEIEILEKFRISRNKFLHGDFVDFMKEMCIEPTGRQIYSNGRRNILENCEIIEAIKSGERNQVFSKFNDLASKAFEIINELIRCNKK
jgi:hypothetical protein